YKYPQSRFPYEQLIEGARQRGRKAAEYELIDTGIFDEDRYFDVFVEYAKARPEDILIRITAFNRASESALLDLLPTIWFKNSWAWGIDDRRPRLRREDSVEEPIAIRLRHFNLPLRWLICDPAGEHLPELLFTENETNYRRLYGSENGSKYLKDGINDYV